MGTCWICSQEAKSKEHIIKKSDLTRVYGNGPYTGENKVVHVKEGKIQKVQGPNSKRIKYRPSLCHHCNTTLTQPFDRAYDKFVQYTYDNEDRIARRRHIDFYDVYGDSFELDQCNLFRYLAKSFGCRLVDAGATVPKDVINLLLNAPFSTGLRLNLSVSEPVLKMPKQYRDRFIGKGELTAWQDKNDQNIVNGYSWSEHISWLFIHYWYLVATDGSLGSTWVADARYLYLGTIDENED